MTRMPRKLALTAIAAHARCVVPATAHADADPVNLPLADDVRDALVQAGAVLTGRPVSEFSGLRAGRTYYAQNPADGLRWAAAAVKAAPGQDMAAVMLQDQTSYMSFSKTGQPGATWVPTAIGFGPVPAGEAPRPLPQNVRDLWGWPSGKCYPPPAG